MIIANMIFKQFYEFMKYPSYNRAINTIIKANKLRYALGKFRTYAIFGEYK